MSTNDRIRTAAYQAAAGKIDMPDRPGLCLTLVRLVIEAALFDGRYELYDRFLVAGTSRRTGDDVGNHRADPWAADLEASVKELQLNVPIFDRLPGDIVFNHLAAAPYGHVGILVERGLVLENIRHAYRPDSVHLDPHMALTPFEHFPITLVARLPEVRS